MSRAIIIGSGIGGLSLACILQHMGISVTVVEKEPEAGGCLRTFKRDGLFFDTGMHIIGSAEPGQITDKFLRFMGVRDDLDLKRLDTSGYDIIHVGDRDYRIANGRDGFIETLGVDFPSEKDHLSTLFDIVEAIAKSNEIKYNTSKISTSPILSEYNNLSIDAVLNRHINDPLLKTVLLGNQILYAGVRDHTPFAVMAFMLDNFNKSTFRIKGGSGNLAELLAKRIVSMGGEIHCRSHVARIDIKNGLAKGVETSDGRYIKGDWIISTIHPKLTFAMLEDSTIFRTIQKQRILAMKNTASVFSVYMKFRENSVLYRNNNYYCNIDGKKDFVYTHNADKCANQTWATGGSLIAYMDFNDVRKWEDTIIGKRGKEYEDFKKKHAENLLEILYSHHPSLRGCVEKYWTSTPLTFRDYTGTEEGAMYGMRPELGTMVPYRTKIPNLFLGGQSILTHHGLQGVMTGSLLIASSIVPGDKLYKKFMEY